MVVNEAALRVALEVNPRYDEAVVRGQNRILLSLLAEEEAGETAFRIVSVQELIEAIDEGGRLLNSNQLARLSNILIMDSIDLSRLAIRKELQSIFVNDTTTVTNLATLTVRTKTYGERYGTGVGLKDLWKVLPLVSKSYMAQYIARG